MNAIDISPAAGPFRATVRIPGSKSITNRALPLAALARGPSTLRGVLFADDTWQMIHALQTLNYTVDVDEAEQVVQIAGGAGLIPAGGAELHCGNSGTTIRFLAALLTLGEGAFVLDGVPRMRQRPIGQLVDQLRRLGAEIDYLRAEGFPPIQINAAGLAGGPCAFDAAISSQFISAVLLAAPYAAEPVLVNLLGAITSEPYVTMTLRMMEQFGVSVEVHDQCSAPASRTIRVPTGRGYQGRDYAIEPDASNASYFLAAAALFEGAQVTVPGLGRQSLQGDVAFAEVLKEMGALVDYGPDSIKVRGTGTLRGIDIDMNKIPDMAQTLAALALFAEGPTTIRNVGNLRVKETDRLAALEIELNRLGARATATADTLRIEPPRQTTPATVATYDDHRMAMSLALVGLRVAGVRIENPECTAKTYPDYFKDLAAAVRQAAP